jgi:hypothetical protein
MEAIDLSMTKEVPLDADVEELLDSCFEVALVGLGGDSSMLPAYSKILGIK